MRRPLVRVMAVLVFALGLPMAVLGGILVAEGGSWYYLLAGVATAICAGLAWRGDRRGLWGYGGVVLATAVWALWDIHAKGWMHAWGFDFLGRVGVMAGLWLLLALAGQRRNADGRRPSWTWWAVGGLVAFALIELAWHWERPVSPSRDALQTAAAMRGGPAAASSPQDASNWMAYGGSNGGERFSTATQITPANVSSLQEAWRFRTGDAAPNDRVFFSFQNTPIKVDNSLYVCSSSAQVFALDPATGERQWHFDPKVSPKAMEPLFSVACRAVAYHAQPSAPPGASCGARILLATMDSRLIALDAQNGKPCEGFGEAGTVDLAKGMGNQAVGLSSTTSGAMVTGNRVIVGQQVSDNQRRDAPSGVVRAYDAVTGELIWAWDAHRIADPKAPLAPGEVFPRGTPNVWNVISADESLGLAFLGTGNSANDHWGADRTAQEDQYTAAVVAVDIETGQTRWHFTTVVHDLWDYDIGAQPLVMNMDIDGTPRKVVVQGTKTGSLFVLDAATGEPLRPVAQVPAPQQPLPGERLAPTQPQSTFFPNFAAKPGPNPERLTEAHAFGLTPIDAALCRIDYRRMRYEGMFTPPTDQGRGMLLFPGTIGGLNWGGLSVNPDAQIVVTNHSRLPNRVQLIPRAEVKDEAIGVGEMNRPDQTVAPQKHAPYGVDRPMWLSALGVPCISPPWGYLSATDLRTGKLLWTQPLGTGFDSGPLGLPTFIKVPLGTANIGGAVSTRSGLTFIAASQDNYFRAFDTRSGELLWQSRLPHGGQAGPMTYMHGGRQYVAIAAGGHARLQTDVGDALVVYALPEGTRP